MNKENREKVTKYLSKIDTSELLFYGLSDEKESELGTLSIDMLLIECLYLSYKYGSINVHGEHETSEGRDRSIIDIWRHAKHFNPDITIFDAMNSIYILSVNSKRSDKKSFIVGHFCAQVGRRVFNLLCNRPNYKPYQFEKEDEFKLCFTDWSEI